jgi:hypothetical protein
VALSDDSRNATKLRNMRLIEQRLIAFATFSFFYQHFLFDNLKDLSNPESHRSAWFEDFFNHKPIQFHTDREILKTLKDFTGDYLKWLSEIGQSLKEEHAGTQKIEEMFEWGNLRTINADVHNLNHQIGQLGLNSAKSDNNYDKIFSKLDSYGVISDTQSVPVGMLIYALNWGISDFCKDNYNWAELIEGTYKNNNNQ